MIFKNLPKRKEHTGNPIKCNHHCGWGVGQKLWHQLGATANPHGHCAQWDHNNQVGQHNGQLGAKTANGKNADQFMASGAV